MTDACIPVESDAPAILTATMDEKAQAFFNGQHRRFFPPDRNYLDAHITMFHKLPDRHLAEIQRVLSAIPSGKPMTAEISDLRFLGGGVAYAVSCDALMSLRASLADIWHIWLQPQDKNAFKPHVTIQNKVPQAEARNLYDTLSSDFEKSSIEITGLALWRYLKGPWSLIKAYPFCPNSDQPKQPR